VGFARDVCPATADCIYSSILQISACFWKLNIQTAKVQGEQLAKLDLQKNNA